MVNIYFHKMTKFTNELKLQIVTAISGIQDISSFMHLPILHVPPVLPSHTKQCISYLPDRTTLCRFHDTGKNILIIDS